VQDQVRLWELERNRLASAPGTSCPSQGVSLNLTFAPLRDLGFLYTEFTSLMDFEMVVGYARKQHAVLWSDPTTRTFFGKADHHPQIKAYVERRKEDRDAVMS